MYALSLSGHNNLASGKSTSETDRARTGPNSSSCAHPTHTKIKIRLAGWSVWCTRDVTEGCGLCLTAERCVRRGRRRQRCADCRPRRCCLRTTALCRRRGREPRVLFCVSPRAASSRSCVHAHASLGPPSWYTRGKPVTRGAARLSHMASPCQGWTQSARSTGSTRGMTATTVHAG